MDNELAVLLKTLENDILELKTAKSYAGVRTAHYTTTANVTNGRYRITYESNGLIMSKIFIANPNLTQFATISPKTPVNNTQDVEIYISEGSQQTVQPLQIISNIPVTSVARI